MIRVARTLLPFLLLSVVVCSVNAQQPSRKPAHRRHHQSKRLRGQCVQALYQRRTRGRRLNRIRAAQRGFD